MINSLTDEQKKLITLIDSKVKAVIKQGGDEEKLLVEMVGLMPGIKNMIDFASEKELKLYYAAYDGFYYYMKLLEKLAAGIACGDISVPQ